MATATKTRSIRLLSRNETLGRFVCRIVSGRQDNLYRGEEIPAYEGRGFRLEKLEDVGGELVATDVYDVLLANGQDCRCDCIGHEHHGHCKHASGLRALLAAGKI